MKLRAILVFAMLAASLSLLSCIVTSRSIGVEISCDEFTEDPHSIRNEFEVEVGDKITVELCSNPTTGFAWTYEMTSENVLQEEDYDFVEPEDDEVVGAAGTDVWTFEAVEKGTTEVNMEYSKPWQDGIKEEWTYTFTVTVE